MNILANLNILTICLPIGFAIVSLFLRVKNCCILNYNDMHDMTLPVALLHIGKLMSMYSSQFGADEGNSALNVECKAFPIIAEKTLKPPRSAN